MVRKTVMSAGLASAATSALNECWTHPATGEPLNEDNSVIVTMKVTRTEEFPMPITEGRKGMTIGNMIDGHIKDIITDGGRVEDLSIHISERLWDTTFRNMKQEADNNEYKESY